MIKLYIEVHKRADRIKVISFQSLGKELVLMFNATVASTQPTPQPQSQTSSGCLVMRKT